VQDTPIKAKTQTIGRHHAARLVSDAGHDAGLVREWCGRSHGGWKAQRRTGSAWTYQLPKAGAKKLDSGLTIKGYTDTQQTKRKREDLHTERDDLLAA